MPFIDRGPGQVSEYIADEKAKEYADMIRKAKEYQQKEFNSITKPDHYHKGGIDVIGYSEQQFSTEEMKGFFRINVVKYVSRYDKKNGMEDLIKAKDYLEKLMELERKREKVE